MASPLGVTSGRQRFFRLLASLAPYALHLVPVVWLFGPSLAGERVLFFRDLSSAFVPDYAFLHSALAVGTWPLYNPLVDGGSPCLFAYPFDLLLVAAFGPLGPLRFGVPLHLVLGMCGVTALASRRGLGPQGAWLTGAVYGLSGVVLSLVNLLPLLHAAAWAPWILVALLDLVAVPSGRARARLALVTALAFSTLGADILLQTLIVAVVLVPGADRLKRWTFLPLVQVGALALLLSAPVMGGGMALLRGSARAAGFSAREALGYSLRGPAVLDVLLPRFFGDVHALTDAGYFGQPFFTQGYPYLLSLYLGPLVLVLALLGVRDLRAPTLVLLSLLLAMGEQGPFGPLLAGALVRFPVKFLWMGTLVVALLAGAGLERAPALRRSARAALGLVGTAILGLATASVLAPGRIVALLAGWLGTGDGAAPVVAQHWPASFLLPGALALAAALALRWREGTLLVGALAACDLLAGNARVNTFTSPRFYELRPEIAAAVAEARREGPFRWFSYGVGDSDAVRLQPTLRGDVWLFALDRQSLFPRTQAIDGLEGIFDADRTGWAPRGASLGGGERRPRAFRSIHPRLQDENVRFVMSFDELPGDLVTVRAEMTLPETLGPLRLYELRDPQPRAFLLPPGEGMPLPPAASIRYERKGPHAVRLRVSGPPGRVVVRDPWRPELRAEALGRPLELESQGRHFAIDTPGGEQEIVVRFRPRWPLPTVVLSLLGGLLALATSRDHFLLK